MRSACRGELRNTSEPKRAISYSADVTVIISIAQHASPIVRGQTDELCAQRATSSSLASMNCPGPSLIVSPPCEAALLPYVGVSDREHHDEDHHLDKTEQPEGMHLHGPRVERRRFDVEDDEQHRDEVEAHGEAAADR